jgi:hypothetical protein
MPAFLAEQRTEVMVRRPVTGFELDSLSVSNFRLGKIFHPPSSRAVGCPGLGIPVILFKQRLGFVQSMCVVSL